MTIDEKYLTDWSGLTRGVPAVVHRPRNTQEVVQFVQSCIAAGQVMTVQGGLTGLAGGAVPDTGDAVINLARMNAVEEVDALEGVMVVQAGVTLEEVQRTAAEQGWHFAVDLGARGSCQVGGNASTNAGGERVLRYGTMRDNILGLEVVLPDGSVMSTMNRLVKNSAGPDMKHLFIGSEGTLGIITRLVLKLQPMPGKATCALVEMTELGQVTQVLRQLRKTLGPLLTAYEFMSAEFIDQAVVASGHRGLPGLNEPWKVLLEVSDLAGIDAGEQLQSALEGLLESGQVVNVLVSQSEQDRQSFWSIRRAIPAMMACLKPTLNFDIGIPWKHMTGYVQKVSDLLNTRCPDAHHLFFGHLGDNNLHLMSGPHPEHHDTIEALVYGALAGLDGTISAEHGVGFVKKPYLGITRSPAELALIRQIKHSLDPHGLLNPGRIL